MSVAPSPSPSGSRGEIVLQPAYFTSSAFVHAARADVDCLIREYSLQYTRAAHSRNRPFALFREIWQRQGWAWMQFKVFDARSRAAFLRVMMRLFSERIDDGETPLCRAAALFGLYTMLRTQPSDSAQSLYSVAQVQVTCDVYEEIMVLPDALDGEFLRAIRPHVVYVQSDLVERHALEILPHAEMYPLNPRVLPREVVVAGEGEGEGGSKPRGRPSRRERTKRAKESLAALVELCEREDGDDEVGDTRGEYQGARRGLVEWVGTSRGGG